MGQSRSSRSGSTTPRVPRDDAGNQRKRSAGEVIVQSVKDRLGIGKGLRGQQIDREVDKATR